MPTYTYECKKCDSTQDEFHAMSASPQVVCISCGSGSMKRRLGTGAGIIFKGSGFYETDYKNKGSEPSKTGDSSKSADSKGSKGAAKSESKSSGSEPSSTSSGSKKSEKAA